MTARVVFFTAQSIGSINAPGVGSARISESVTVPGTTAAAALAGELVMIYNGETGAIMVAHGPAPDAATTTATAASSAGFPVPAGQCSPTFVVAVGAKINIKNLT